MAKILQVEMVNSKTRGQFVLGQNGVSLIAEHEYRDAGFMYSVHTSCTIIKLFDVISADWRERVSP